MTLVLPGFKNHPKSLAKKTQSHSKQLKYGKNYPLLPTNPILVTMSFFLLQNLVCLLYDFLKKTVLFFVKRALVDSKDKLVDNVIHSSNLETLNSLFHPLRIIRIELLSNIQYVKSKLISCP